MASNSHMMAIEKLTGRDNWTSWSFAVKAYLQHEELWDSVQGENTDAKKDLKAKSKLILLVDPMLYVHIQEAKSAKEVWDNLTQAFQDSGLLRKVGLLKDLINTTLENCSSVEDYVNKLMSSAHKLRNISFQVDDEWLGTLMLAGLPDVYKPMIMGIESSGVKISADLIKTKLLQEVTRSDATAFYTNFKNKYAKSNLSPSQTKPKGPRCFSCNRHGHLSKNCWHKKNKSDAKNNKDNCGFIAAFSAMQSNNDINWYVDTGCSHHSTLHREWLENVRTPPINNITIANNKELHVECCGDLTIQVPDKNGGSNAILVREVLFVPELATNLLSVGMIIKSGCEIDFHKKGCDIKNQTGQIVATCTEMNNTYKLNVINKEVKAMTATTATDTYLMHQRMGHLNFNDVDKIPNCATGVQLVQQSESCVCVSCLEGKQTRQPFPSSGSRAKELLELIHSDVCGPLQTASVGGCRRGDPIRLCRAISKMVNANDRDGGILIGNWTGKYEDGTAPFNWTGSVDIMQEYLKMKRSVAYGQCWVFACVTTTVCRALGIPSRVVTNVVSAHDTDCSLSIDKYYNEAMNNISGDDSIWNFHVWNDVWMARPDLPSGYGGWQAIDATPQEKSEGKCQCGPASLEAIKKGELGMNYDVAFVLASVNADVLRWRKDPHSELGYSVVETSKDYVGQMVLTKKPLVFDPLGDEDCEDITDQYKYSEGSTAERVALMNGACHSERAKRCYELASKVKSDVSFKLRDIDAVNIGNDFRIVVDIDNKSEEPRNIKAVLTATSVFYNGVRAEQVKTVQGKIFLGPNKHDEIVIDVTAEDYLPKLVEYCNMKISAMALVDETKQCWADDDDFRVMKPTINIKVNDNLVINQPREAFLSFLNPLDRTLTGCEFRVTSPGLAGRTVRVPARDTLAKKRVVASLPVTPNTLGRIHIVATFTSNELKEITGAATVDVLEN